MKLELHECHFKILLRPESIRLENVPNSASLIRYNGGSPSITVTQMIWINQFIWVWVGSRPTVVCRIKASSLELCCSLPLTFNFLCMSSGVVEIQLLRLAVSYTQVNI